MALYKVSGTLTARCIVSTEIEAESEDDAIEEVESLGLEHFEIDWEHFGNMSMYDTDDLEATIITESAS